MNLIVFLFSGQGSHFEGMGRELFEQDEVYRATLYDLDAVAQDELGLSIVDRLHGRTAGSDAFDRTRLTHPAIYMVELALATSLMARGVKPDLVMSASLGVFAAAAIAGAIDGRDGLRLVVRQAQYIEAYCPRGGMIAVLAPLQQLHDRPWLRGEAELAGVNLDDHFVLAAAAPRMARVLEGLAGEGITHQRLAVSHAFHSEHIDSAADPFLADARGMRWSAPRCPIVCCAQAGTLPAIDGADTWSAVRRPIRFAETLAALETEGPHSYVDVGPSGTLAGFVKRSPARHASSTTRSILSPFGGGHRLLRAVAEELAPMS
jgi:acyl transferase domain-containing protein